MPKEERRQIRIPMLVDTTNENKWEMEFDEEEFNFHYTATVEAVQQLSRSTVSIENTSGSRRQCLPEIQIIETESDPWTAPEKNFYPVSPAVETLPTDADLEQLEIDAMGLCRAEHQDLSNVVAIQLPFCGVNLHVVAIGLFLVLYSIEAYLLLPEEGTTTLRALGRLSRLCRDAWWLRCDVHQHLRQLDEEITNVYWEATNTSELSQKPKRE